jgi:hypothetical protein
MEITGPDRLNVASSITVAAKGLQKVENAPLSEELVGSRLRGCKGTSIAKLLARTRPQLGSGVSGVFTAADGVSTDPIELGDLVKGFIIHSDAADSGLSASLGGPLRVVFPSGVKVQNSICGKPKPVNLKGVVRLDLHSEYEIKDVKVNKELTASAPRLIAELEEYHRATLLAFAKHFGGVAELGRKRISVSGLDARGFMLRVTDIDSQVDEEVLAPFPRPLESAADVFPLAMEMHRAAYAAADFKFKLSSRYYTEPLTVAVRIGCRSPAIVAALCATAAVGLAGLALLRCAGGRRAQGATSR